MKRNILSILMACVLCFSMPLMVCAAEPVNMEDSDQIDVNSEDVAVPQSSVVHSVGSDFKTVYTGNMSRTVAFTVRDFNPADYQMDIMMNGNRGLLWQEDDCLGKNANGRTFTVGSDVKNIQIRIIPRSRLFPAPSRYFLVDVTSS